MKTQLYSYVRWSSDKQTGNSSLERQTRKSKEYAARNGLEWAELRDEAVSAYRGANWDEKKSALGGFIGAVKKGLVPSDSWLYVESLDRLSRQNVLDATEWFISVLKLGITIVTGMDEHVYNKESIAANATGLMMSIMLFARANEESETKSKRVVSHAKQLIERHKEGKPATIKSAGSHVWWIDSTGDEREGVKPHPEMWEPAKLIVEMFKEGESIFRIVAALRERYPYGFKGRDWSGSTIKNMRVNPALYGCRTLKFGLEENKLENYYPALCTEAEFYRIQEVKSNNRFRANKSSSISLLAGMRLIRCGQCGGTMNTLTTTDGKLRYVCSSGLATKGGGGTRSWSLSGILIEHCLMIVLSHAYFDASIRNQNSATDLDSQIEKYEIRIAELNTEIKNIASGIAKHYSEALVELLAAAEKERKKLVQELDRTNQKKLLLTANTVFEKDMLNFFELIQWGIISDPTHETRVKLREIVRRLMQSVVIHKRDGIVSLHYSYKEGEYFVFEGAGKRHEWTYYIKRDKQADNTVSPEIIEQVKNHRLIKDIETSLYNLETDHEGMFNLVLDMLAIVNYPKLKGSQFWPKKSSTERTVFKKPA